MTTGCSTLAVRCPVASIAPVRSSHCKAVTKGNQQWIVRQAQKLLQKKEWRNAAFAAINTITISMPAAIAMAAEEMTEEKQPGKLFDFDATLPIIVIQFLLLMVALDKIYFTPLGDFMDARDEMIRKKLESVKDNSEEIKKLQEEAEALIQAARAETTAALNNMKKETAAELEAKLQSSRERIEKELAQALANLEEQKQETLKSLEKQVQLLSEKIVEKVLPPVATK